jgi:hypothetical protein
MEIRGGGGRRGCSLTLVEEAGEFSDLQGYHLLHLSGVFVSFVHGLYHHIDIIMTFQFLSYLCYTKCILFDHKASYEEPTALLVHF